MAATKTPPCPIGKSRRHVWVWEKDLTIKRMSYGSSGTKITYAAKGRYVCVCGLSKIGAPKGGL